MIETQQENSLYYENNAENDPRKVFDRTFFYLLFEVVNYENKIIINNN